MLRNVRPASIFSTRLISLLLCYGLFLSQLSFAIPQAAAFERRNVKFDVPTSKSGVQAKDSASGKLNMPGIGWLSTLLGYASNTSIAPSPLQQQQSSSSTIVISQIYGGGGNSGSTYKNDFIELFNRSNTIVDLTNWSVQYSPATSSAWQVTALSGSLGPGQYLLIQEALGAGGTTNLPTPDVAGAISMSATAGKVALVNNSTPLGYNYPQGNPNIADFVGYGSSTGSYEGSGPTPSPSNTNAVSRANNGCTDTDYNSTDFDAASPNPRNSSSPVNACGGGLPPSSTVVISEFRTRGLGGGYDEFVELYNMTSNAIDISGWRIAASNSGGGVATRVTFNPGTTLPAHGHFLATNNISSGGYTDAVVGDQTYTTGIPDDGGIAVVKPDGTIVDRVGMSSGSAFKESRALNPLTINANQSYERKAGGGSGSSQDTNDNPSDFQVRATSDPQNLQSPPTNPNNQPPVVNAGGPYTGMAGTAVQFSSNGSNDPDGNITNHQWSFGDGTSGAEAYPSHVYASAGTYTATLTVTDNNGSQNSASVTVTITAASNQPPIANLGGPYSAATETSIQFNGSGSSDPDGTIVSYTWDFGDLTTGTGPNLTHAYISPQTYRVTLTVVDNEGATATASIEVSITKTPGLDDNNSIVGDGVDVGWGTGNAPSAEELDNQRGNLPGHAEGNNNFQITAPVLSLPGRGLNVNLNLIYNSLLWNKSGNEIAYDIDHDWPAPGWQFGFGKMVYTGSGVMIVEADGSRHGFTGTLSYENASQLPVFKGNTTDGSFIEYRCEMRSQPNGVARYPSGTVVYYNNFAKGFNANAPNNYLYPTLIVDSNGNYIQIKYDWDQREPRMERVVDSLGRIIDFHYFTASDGTRLLSAITTKGIKDDNGAVTTRTLIRLHYKQIIISTSGAFSGLTPRVYKSSPWVIDAIYYPATSTGYWFGDDDSYSSYGMIRKVVEQRGMGFSSTSLTEMGTVTAGTMTRQQDYAYPQSSSNLTKAPTFGTMAETWEGKDIDTVPVTTFEILDPAAPGDRVVTITRPDNTKIVQRSYNLTNLADTDPNKTKNGLVYHEEILGENNVPLQKTDKVWEPGFNKTPRLKRIEVTDDLGQMLATEYDNYGDYNSVGRVREYDYDGSVLRTTITEYLNYTDSSLNGQLTDPATVITPRLINLVSAVTLYTGDNSANKKAAVTEYKYDEYAQPLRAYAANYNGSLDLYMFGEVRNTIIGIFSHSGKFNPLPYNNIDGGGSGPDKYITKRGNVTKVIQYADPDNPTAASNLTVSNTYDMTGNIIAKSSTCCEQSSFSYELAMQYAYPTSKTRGSADENSLARMTTSATYDFNTGLVLSVTDANGRTTQNKYDAASLQLKKSLLPTGARTEFEYEPGALKVTQTTYTSPTGTTIADKNVRYLNGLGSVRREESLGTDGTDVVETKYDQLGRVWKRTRPYRDGDTVQWNETVYDLLGRTISVRAPGFDAGNPSNPGNTATSIFYNSNAPAPAGASTGPGQTAKTVDAWGRWRWTRLNSRGQLAEVVEPNPDGGNGFVTKYSYDAPGNLIKVEQGEQVRRFHYDALRRLTRQKLAETEATLNKDGERATNEQLEDRWSDVFAYDARSNMTAHTDARGVRTNYNYNNDPLNRLQSVTYDRSRVDTATLEVLPAAELQYDYRTKTSTSQLINITQPKKVTAVGVSTEEYDYAPTTGLLAGRRLQLPGLSKTLNIDYEYDTLERVSQITYPQQYQGVEDNNPARKVVKPNYDVAGRLDGLKVNDVNFALNAKYNAASQMTSVVTGNASKIVETYNYNPRSGLLTSQAIKRGSNTLLGFKYGYCQGGQCAEDEAMNYAYTGQVTQIETDGWYASGSYSYSYDSLGRLKNALHSYGYYVAETFQLIVREDGTVECVGTGQSGAPYDSQIYSYDQYGNRTTVVTNGFSSSQNQLPPQDGRGPLTYQKSTSVMNSSISSDAASNQKGTSTAQMFAYDYDAKSNRIANTGFSYDAAGNQKETSMGQVYIYDAAGRLAKVKQNGITVASYIYGATRHRLMTQHGAEDSTQKTYYVWHGDSVIAEYGAASTIPQWTKNYIYFGSRLLATQQPDGAGGELVQYHHPDRLGTRLITNNKDTNVSRQETLPYGTSWNEGTDGTSNRRFTSYDRSSETGLDYAVNRYYDSREGRFTQVDPLGIQAASLTDPQSLNMYAYAGNDPINRNDPDGLFSWGALFGGLFRAFFPQKISFSFTYKSLPPISVSFSNNFSNIFVGFAGAELQVKGPGPQKTGEQLSSCLRDNLRQFFPQQTVHGDKYSPIDEARFHSGVPFPYKQTVGPSAITLGLYNIFYDPKQVNLGGKDNFSLRTIIEEVSHTEQFLQVWAAMPYSHLREKNMGDGTPSYGMAQFQWAQNYILSSAMSGFSYDNSIEREAKDKVNKVIATLSIIATAHGQSDVCGFSLN